MGASLTIAEAVRALLKRPPSTEGGWKEPEIRFYLNDMAALDYQDVTWNYRQAIDGYRSVVEGIRSTASISKDLFDDCTARPAIDITVCMEAFPVLSANQERSAEEAKAYKKLQTAQDRFKREFPKTDFSTISAYDIDHASRLNAQAQRYGNTPDFLDKMRLVLQKALQEKISTGRVSSR